MLRIKQLMVLPANLITPDINTGLRGIARLSMKNLDVLILLGGWAYVLNLFLLTRSIHRALPERTELVRRFIEP